MSGVEIALVALAGFVALTAIELLYLAIAGAMVVLGLVAR